MSQPLQTERTAGLTAEDARLLADFRHLLRQFFVFSEKSARSKGVTAQNHRALLALRTLRNQATVGELAERLVIRHHSAVELVDRLVRAGLVTRRHDPDDRRRVTVELTELGDDKLSAISGANRQELRRLAPLLKAILVQLEQ